MLALNIIQLFFFVFPPPYDQIFIPVFFFLHLVKGAPPPMPLGQAAVFPTDVLKSIQLLWPMLPQALIRF